MGETGRFEVRSGNNCVAKPRSWLAGLLCVRCQRIPRTV